MPHKKVHVNKEVRADKPIINPAIEAPLEGTRRVKFYCIGEVPANNQRCVELQIGEGAPKNLARPCEGSCLVKLIRQKSKTRRIIEG